MSAGISDALQGHEIPVSVHLHCNAPNAGAHGRVRRHPRNRFMRANPCAVKAVMRSRFLTEGVIN
ncbi:hypothetical protein OZ10_04760 [Xanthomonas cannabis pv. cannabis]|nr:hypothetical protein OZ10_04760 [Xanthomonas cannabis pv. cannabis]